MKIRTWAVAVAASALLVAACGSDDDSEPEETAAPEETSDDSSEDDDTTDDAGGDAMADWPDEIVLGLVPSQEVDQLVLDAEVLGELLTAELGHPVTTNVTDSYTALVLAMGSGQAHIGMFGPIALVQAADQVGADIVLQSVRFGSSTYHTQWFTNDTDRFCSTDVVEVEQENGSIYTYCNGTDEADTGPVGEDALNELEDGETIFFVEEGSASGYYYPATQVQTITGKDPFSDIDAQFAGDHPATLQGVQRGDAAVGVSFDDARDNLVEEDPQIGEDVTVFAYSEEIPNDGVAVAGDLPDDLKQAISDAFVAVMETEEGAAAFDAVYSIEGLVPADLGALDAARQVESNFGDQ
jgi:phosphonate transport system substrate-binding protein